MHVETHRPTMGETRAGGRDAAGQHGQVPTSTDSKGCCRGKTPGWSVSELGSHSTFDPDSEQPVPGHFPSTAGGWPRSCFPSHLHSCLLAVLFPWAGLGRKVSLTGWVPCGWASKEGRQIGGQYSRCSTCLPGTTLTHKPMQPPSLPRAQRPRQCCLPSAPPLSGVPG